MCAPFAPGDYAPADPGDAVKPFDGQADHTAINGIFGGPAIPLPITND